MMINRQIFLYATFALMVILVAMSGCKKYLDVKSQQSLAVPQSLEDLDALLNNEAVLNEGSTTFLSEAFSDNYYVTSTSYNSLSLPNRQSHVWAADYIETGTTSEWSRGYTNGIYVSNNVLDLVKKIEETAANKIQRDAIIGRALFFRSFAFENLAQVSCRPYSPTASTDLGLILKLNANISEKTRRATVEETYNQIINDLKLSSDLLPETSQFPTQPTKVAAFAELARTYLSMRDYNNAFVYADKALQKKGKIVDYNTLVPVKSPPFQIYNEEVIYHSRAFPATLFSATNCKIDPQLYQSYSNDDLRKTLFFLQNSSPNLGTYQFRGSYQGSFGPATVWNGLTTAEMVLIRGECNARAGRKDAALDDLNALMAKRWNSSNGSWKPFTASTSDDAKSLILSERRKELVFRTLRWSDVRRLNLEGANITLQRNIGGTLYTLPPNDLRTVALIPLSVIALGGIPQNPR
jgi:tetratricopeptide (TPR) repeat protein